MVTPWQARLAVVGFLAIGAAISANLLLLQERRTATTSVRPQVPRATPDIAVRTRAVASQGPETKSVPPTAASRMQPVIAGSNSAGSRQRTERGKKVRNARSPATTASTR
jgi:hypothetical protein